MHQRQGKDETILIITRQIKRQINIQTYETNLITAVVFKFLLELCEVFLFENLARQGRLNLRHTLQTIPTLILDKIINAGVYIGYLDNPSTHRQEIVFIRADALSGRDEEFLKMVYCVFGAFSSLVFTLFNFFRSPKNSEEQQKFENEYMTSIQSQKFH